MYVAAVLAEKESLDLKSLVIHTLKDTICVDLLESEWLFKTPSGGPLPHHMTINMGALDEELNPPSVLGKKVLIDVRNIYYDQVLGVCAVGVASCCLSESGNMTIHSANAHGHITVALKDGVKPKVSNELFGPRRKSTMKLPFSTLCPAVIKLCD